MEVHHHPDVEKKSFKEYLLEGLMIFLAVTMGFFAESLREHINERSRSKEYAVTLVSDLKADTADLNVYIDYFGMAANSTDTLMHLLSSSEFEQIPTAKLYWFGLTGGAHGQFITHDATFQEMTNSGSTRFFGNKVIRRQLAQYDQLCQIMKANDLIDAPIYTEVRRARAQIFYYKYNDAANRIWQATNRYGHKNPALQRRMLDTFYRSNPTLLAQDKTLINQYVEMVRSRFFRIRLDRADTLLKRSTELIAMLKKKYEPEEE